MFALRSLLTKGQPDRELDCAVLSGSNLTYSYCTTHTTTPIA